MNKEQLINNLTNEYLDLQNKYNRLAIYVENLRKPNTPVRQNVLVNPTDLNWYIEELEHQLISMGNYLEALWRRIAIIERYDVRFKRIVKRF